MHASSRPRTHTTSRRSSPASRPATRTSLRRIPERGFVGRDQVRKNWEQILAFIPDVTTSVSCQVSDIWTEWEHRGTRRDGTKHLMRGVIIFGVSGGLAAWARFYLEPVEEHAGTMDEAVRRQVVAGQGAKA